MFKNALIERYRFSQLRPKYVWLFFTIYVTIVLLIAVINASALKINGIYSSRHLCHNLYYQLLVAEILIVCFWSSYLSGTVIRDEIANKSYDFFRTLPLPPASKAVGILIGRNLVPLLLAALGALLVLILGVAGKVSPRLQCHVMFIVFSTAILFNTVSLLSSLVAPPTRKATGAGGLILIGLLLLPGVAAGLANSIRAGSVDMIEFSFYGVACPAMLLVGWLSIYFSVWAFIGVTRRFTREAVPLFTPTGAGVFLLGTSAIALGFFWHALRATVPAPAFAVVAFCLVSAIPLVILPFASRKTLNMYLERSGQMEEPVACGMSVLRFLPYSNLSAWLILYLQWACFALWALRYQGDLSWPTAVGSVLMMFTFYVFFVLLVELYTFYESHGKMHILLCFVVGLHLFLPMILASTLQAGELVRFSPFGFIAFLSGTLGAGGGLPPGSSSVWGLNVLLCVVPAYLIAKRCRMLVAAREEMRRHARG